MIHLPDGDDVDSADQPVDFSQKYHEKPPSPSGPTYDKVVKNYNKTFSMYAETDLDQPTNYSLRYAEDNSEAEAPKTHHHHHHHRHDKIEEANNGFEIVDTIKTYCTEDTPYETPFNFSTSTSMSDLRIGAEDNNRATDAVIKEEEGGEGKDDGDGKKGDVKVVKFEEVVNYAETPLMFSRTSSLASLDSIEQHSIHDDLSSVVSDFSRLTSGIISPSDLPDSPTQSIPQSPRPNSKNNSARAKLQFSLPDEDDDKPEEDDGLLLKSSVFEDAVKNFKMESTPLHFSTATSLSSLNVDELELEKLQLIEEVATVEENHAVDEERGCADDHEKEKEGKATADEEEEGENLRGGDEDDDDDDEEVVLSDDDDEDDDFLNACINIGMQSNRYNNQRYKVEVMITAAEEDDDYDEPKTAGDSVTNYCTEDTPAILSHAGSHSDLSGLLSAPGGEEREEQERQEVGEEKKETRDDELAQRPTEDEVARCEKEIRKRSEMDDSYLSDINSILSEDEEDDDESLLQACIRSGMDGRMSRGKTNVAINDLGHGGVGVAKAAINLNISQELNLNDSCESDDGLLQECIRSGMSSNKFNTGPKTDSDATRKKPKRLRKKKVNSRDEEILNLDLSENDKAELQECILSGMRRCQAKTPPPNDTTSGGDLSESDRLFLQECIQEGMRKMQISPAKAAAPKSTTRLSSGERLVIKEYILESSPPSQGHHRHQRHHTTKLSNGDRLLLKECILEGMRRNIPPSKFNHLEETLNLGTRLSDGNRLLLREYILMGMPKSGTRSNNNHMGESEQALFRECTMEGMKRYQMSKRQMPQIKHNGSNKMTVASPPKPRMNNGTSSSGHNGKALFSVLTSKIVGTTKQWLKQPATAGSARESNGMDYLNGDERFNNFSNNNKCCVHCPRNQANYLARPGTSGYSVNKTRARPRDPVGNVGSAFFVSPRK